MQWLKRMKENQTRQEGGVAENGLLESKLVKDFSLQEYVPDNDNHDRNSVIKMFSAIEEKNKQDVVKEAEDNNAAVEMMAVQNSTATKKDESFNQIS
jgi:hypothetical protein